MATTTPNYGWPVPTSTDLVKDGATAIEDLGDAIDATVFGLATAVQQIKNATFSAVATGTTTIPLDDTIPQNTEGDEYMTLSITPSSATNILVIEVLGFFTNNTANRTQIMALFEGTTANALAASAMYMTNGPETTLLSINYTMTAGVTTALTFKVRCGTNAAATTTFNGQNGARLFGAITKSSIIITEYKP